ncbi:hypothetical protein HanIR_Chr09g0419661 [Helianthus annuus]|nr:hypothetical protein HanIR_Chr09g0419661 [Helianthus annuus]
MVKDRIQGSASNPILLWQWSRVPTHGAELNELADLFKMLERMVVSDGDDKWVWNGAGNEGFSITAVKELLCSGHDYSQRYVLKWCKWLPSKCDIFVPRAKMGKIPTTVA